LNGCRFLKAPMAQQSKNSGLLQTIPKRIVSAWAADLIANKGAFGHFTIIDCSPSGSSIIANASACRVG
ncbi:hypothetical protein Q1J55_25520, partial [Pseudomonas syringae]|uniref:hypothetical protein n=1 Tax=Pseudomonas syringae TaxID=317 RepID=UPI0034D6EA5F